MNPNLRDKNTRMQIIKDIKSNENIKRKLKAFYSYEIFKDQIHNHVFKYLVKQFGKESAASMPIISSVNIAKKVVTEEAGVYLNSPTRTFSDTDDTEIEILQNVFKDGRFNAKLKKANEYFKLFKGQICVQVILQDQKICMRVVLPHQMDVIPDAENPEKAYAYITSSFDKTSYIKSDGINEVIADKDDDRALYERYTVWSLTDNFIMNGKGDIVSGDAIDNEIEMIPFVDISTDKDGEFFVLSGENDTDFTVQYNGCLSDLQNICRLQGYAQAVFIGDPKAMPDIVRTGPNVVIKVATPPEGSAKPDFKFESPTPNIEGSLKALEMLLANYLTTRGIDSKAISSSLDATTTYASGVERLLAMLEEFEASQDDFEIFSAAEQEIFNITKAFLVKYSDTEYLDQKYWIQQKTKNAEMTIAFGRPEAVKTESETIADLQLGMEMEIEDQVTACIKLKGMTEDQAMEYLRKLKARKGEFGGPVQEPKPMPGDGIPSGNQEAA